MFQIFISSHSSSVITTTTILLVVIKLKTMSILVILLKENQTFRTDVKHTIYYSIHILNSYF